MRAHTPIPEELGAVLSGSGSPGQMQEIRQTPRLSLGYCQAMLKRLVPGYSKKDAIR